MDKIKDNHSYDYMKPWHYANFGEGKAVEIFKGTNIMYQLRQTLKALKNKDWLIKAEIKLNILYLFSLNRRFITYKKENPKSYSYPPQHFNDNSISGNGL